MQRGPEHGIIVSRAMRSRDGMFPGHKIKDHRECAVLHVSAERPRRTNRA
jgi:hypothetical protein